MIEIIAEYDRLLFEYILVYFDTHLIFTISGYIVEEKYYLFIILPLYIYYSIKDPRNALRLTFMIIILVIYTEGSASILKAAIAKLRPSTQIMIRYYPSSYSFPSAHALNSMGVFTFLAAWFNKKSLIWFAIIIGIARMLAGYHFPSDILGGWIIGYFLAILVIKLFPHFMRDSGSSTGRS